MQVPQAYNLILRAPLFCSTNHTPVLHQSQPSHISCHHFTVLTGLARNNAHGRFICSPLATTQIQQLTVPVTDSLSAFCCHKLMLSSHSTYHSFSVRLVCSLGLSWNDSNPNCIPARHRKEKRERQRALQANFSTFSSKFRDRERGR